ncbi:MAG: arylamine N-acetyltransferase [Bacillales bacterium]|jgi:N-hydroxyarylamine O-acetyltransferase|nr:arylamine N-acetyltransferase [Bacillales bacterium]
MGYFKLIGGMKLNDFQLKFRKRIGISDSVEVKFENLGKVLKQTAMSIPFENLYIVENKLKEITYEGLIEKIITRQEGGVCYELNYILYLFLLENGFDAYLVRGVVYDQANRKWSATGRTHVAIIIRYNEEEYLVDTGFGSNLPLIPIPLAGGLTSSDNGEFQVEKSGGGDYILHMKLENKDNKWEIGYMFDANKIIEDLNEINEIHKIILEHPESPFNKKPLITKLTNTGRFILTNTSFTEWSEGIVTKKDIDEKTFKETVKQYIGEQRKNY